MRYLSARLAFLVGAAPLAGPLLAQTPSNDSCATPAVAIVGTTAFHNSAASTSGFGGGPSLSCMSPSNPDDTSRGQIHQDLYWTFTTPWGGFVPGADLNQNVTLTL